MKLVIITVLCIISFRFPNLYGKYSNINFEHFNLYQGLPPNVNCIFQDQEGYIWFGASYGIYRYDGYSIKPYAPREGDSTSIANACVEAICDDNEGNMWIGHAHGLDKFNPEKEIFTHYTINPKMPLTDWSNHVLALYDDHKGNLWIGTGGGLYLFNENAGTFKWIKHDSTNPGSITNDAVNAIYADRSGSLWFGTGKGLDRLEKKTNRFIHYWNAKNHAEDSGMFDNPYWILSIFEDKSGIMWLGTNGGLVEFNRKTNTFTLYKNDPGNPESLANNEIVSICEGLNGFLWISTQKGLDLFDKKAGKFFHYTHNEKEPGSISCNSVAKILLDRSGAFWVSTYGSGVNKYTPPNQSIRQYVLNRENNGSLPAAEIVDLVEDNSNIIWIGTDKGLISFDPNREVFKRDPFKMAVSKLLLDKKGTLWISTQNGGIFYKKENDKKIYKFIDLGGKSTNCVSMCNSKDGNIWISLLNGYIYKLYPDSKKVNQVLFLNYFVNSIYEDFKGLLWIGTQDGGLFCYNPINKKIKVYTTDPKDTTTISSNQITDFCEDGTGTLWIIANAGLNKFDRVRQKVIRISGREGLPKDVFSLINDLKGNLWISTINGVVKFNPATKEIKKYANINLCTTEYKTRNGELYFIVAPFVKEKQRIIRFNPDSLKKNDIIPPIVITSFRKFEKPSPFGKEIHLNYDENFISFEFSALNYIDPEKNQYAYKMEGIDKDWIYSGTRHYASYPDMAPGKYIFRVKGSNNDGVWNEAGTSISIIISPPLWKTSWAYISYGFILILFLYGLRNYELNRLKLKNKIKMDAAVLKEKEDIDKMKSRFFANISHEFRTPLTLILGPSEKIISGTSDNIKKDASIIKGNSRRLLQLINQLLDLSKLESGKLKLEASKGNIVSFVKGVALSFESLSEEKDITLQIQSEKEFIELYFDKEKMLKIFTNILSNAFKFTPRNGKITVSIIETNSNQVISKESSTEKSHDNGKEIYQGYMSPSARNDNVKRFIQIKIKDTGIGIPHEEIPKLFDRFYQVDSSFAKDYEGTGIGLALTKELVELHHGGIFVESEMGHPENSMTGWTEFTVYLPSGKEHLKEDEILIDRKPGKPEVSINEINLPAVNQESLLSQDNYEKTNGDNEANQANDEKIIILIVEDNYDMREYIKESLGDEYCIEEAINGKQGVRKAEMIIPDLIISDMMMPKMDGNELVKAVKNDEKTSHIPIILLTAKAGYEDKLEGLETGADDYLTKPFDIKELQIRVRNLIRIRKSLQEKFRKREFVSRIEIKQPNSVDEKFINKVLEVIEKHISEESFSIEELGNEIGMSRTQFYRKLKAITGIPASIYLRTVRLTEAKKMIEKKRGNISEIAFSVGFSSPSYFAKCFKDEFGYSPSNLTI